MVVSLRDFTTPTDVAWDCASLLPARLHASLHGAARDLKREYPENWESKAYGFPEANWKHLPTTNVVESPFAAARLQDDGSEAV